MKTIWKKTLILIPSQKIQLPKDANLISVHRQGNDICIWAEVDQEAEMEDIEILIHGTGAPIEKIDMETQWFIGTVILGEFVWHIYARIK